MAAGNTAPHPLRRMSTFVTGTLVLFVTVWVSSGPLVSSFAANPPGGSTLSVDPQLHKGVPAMLGTSRDADLDAALQRQQCPARNSSANVTIAFLHVPKTAGNYLRNVLLRAMPATGSGRYCRKGQDYSKLAFTPCGSELGPEHMRLLADLQANFTTECSGFNAHQDYGFFQALGIDHSRTLTLVALRHPVERGLSHYYFQMKLRKSKPQAFQFWPKNDSDYSGLVAFAAQQRRQANYHTYMLGGSLGCHWPGGTAPLTDDAEILERAKRNLERFCVILITEFMDESMQLLGEATGWPDSVLFGSLKASKTNTTPRPKVPLEVKRAIAAANHLDMQLYAHAVQLFLQRSQAAARQALASNSR